MLNIEFSNFIVSKDESDTIWFKCICDNLDEIKFELSPLEAYELMRAMAIVSAPHVTECESWEFDDEINTEDFTVAS